MAIKNIEINNVEQLNAIIWDQKYSNNVNRYRSTHLYRGLPNEGFHLATGLQRNCGMKKEDVELSILRNFTKYAAMDDPMLLHSVWRQLIMGQHHGLPTRLLDWSYSALIGLHFATCGEELKSMDKHNCVLWQIDVIEMNKRLPNEYQELLKERKAYLVTVDMIEELTKDVLTEQGVLKKYDKDMKDNAMVILEPPSIDERIINQYSYFSVIPRAVENGGDDLGIERFLDTTDNTVKYIINANLKWRIRDMLDQMNISERIVYPGLDGIAAWIKRRYYVKK